MFTPLGLACYVRGRHQQKGQFVDNLRGSPCDIVTFLLPEAGRNNWYTFFGGEAPCLPDALRFVWAGGSLCTFCDRNVVSARHGLAGWFVGRPASATVLGSCQGWRCHYYCRTTAHGRSLSKTISVGDGGVMWPNRQSPPGQQEVDEKIGTVRRPDSILAS